MKMFRIAACLPFLLAGQVTGQTLSVEDFRDAERFSSENPSVLTPVIRRSDLLASVMSADLAAVTAENLINHHATASPAGCQDLLMMNSGDLSRRDVLVRAKDAGVEIRNVAVTGEVGISSIGNGFTLDPSGIQSVSMPGIDQGFCSQHGIGIVKSFSIAPIDLPAIIVDPILFAELDMLLTRRGLKRRVCVQISGNLDARRSISGGNVERGMYDVFLVPELVRIGESCRGRKTGPMNGSLAGPDPHLARQPGAGDLSRSSGGVSDYVATARLVDGVWEWSREILEIMPDGSVESRFEPIGDR